SRIEKRKWIGRAKWRIEREKRWIQRLKWRIAREESRIVEDSERRKQDKGEEVDRKNKVEDRTLKVKDSERRKQDKGEEVDR
ncbi:hypothetical protein, partial [Lysinibacillus sp. D4A3_S15]